jgi:hypothetical protein
MGAKIEWKRNKDDIVYWGNKGAILVGKFSSVAGPGIKVSSARTAALKVHGDDGEVINTTGTVRALQGRLLLTAVHTGATFCGVQGQIKMIASATGANPDWACGVWGYAEAIATSTVKKLFGVRATVDVPSGVTIGTGSWVAGLAIDSIYLDGTHTGKAVCIYVPEPVAGDWDAFMEIAAANTCVNASSTKSTPSGVDNWLVIQVGGVDHYVPMYHSKTA